MLLSPVSRLFWKSVLWLPICFAVWYYLSIVLVCPLEWLVEKVMVGLYPQWVFAVEKTGYSLEIITHFTLPNQNSLTIDQANPGYLTFDINPLTYGYSLPLFSALLFASPALWNDKMPHWGIGIVILLVVQAIGISFDILKTILFELAPTVREAIEYKPWLNNGVALGYQFTYLILPAVAPLTLWCFFQRDFLKKLMPELFECRKKPSLKIKNG
ncbi:MAG: exosortase H-associated membrane protein [Methylococcaceae bacterium]